MTLNLIASMAALLAGALIARWLSRRPTGPGRPNSTAKSKAVQPDPIS